MFRRQVTMKLEANSAKEMSRLNNHEIIPMLHKHKETLTNVVEGTPRVKTFKLVSSTIHQTDALAKAA